MAAPTSYDENTLAVYMDTLLGSLADVLDWTSGSGSFDEAINETLLAYGVDDIADATDIRKLRTLARREVWALAVQALVAGDFDKTAESGASLSLSQRLTNAQQRLTDAINDATIYDTTYGIQRRRIVRSDDPYVWLSDAERAP